MCVKCLYKATTKTSWHEPAFSLVTVVHLLALLAVRAEEKTKNILKSMSVTGSCQNRQRKFGPFTQQPPRPTLPGSGAWFDREARWWPGRGWFGGSWLTILFRRWAGPKCLKHRDIGICKTLVKRCIRLYNVFGHWGACNSFP